MKASKDYPVNTGVPRYRIIFGVDVKDSTTRNDAWRGVVRAAMYDMVERSLSASGVDERYRDDLLDRGDGVFALIHPVDEIPKTRLLDTVVPDLHRQLLEYATHVGPPLRLRAVLHAGEVNYDEHGPYGEQMDVAFRLLESPDVKQRFNATESPLILVVSDPIYHGIVRHGYPGIEERAFGAVTEVLVGGQCYHGWAYVPPDRGHKPERATVVDERGRRIARPSWRFRFPDPPSLRAGDRVPGPQEAQSSHARP